MENITGLMSAGTSESSKSSPLLAQFRAALSPSGGAPRTLEQRLAELSDAERKSLIQTAKLVQMGLRMRVASSATLALNWSENFRLFVISVFLHRVGIHLNRLSDFAGPLQSGKPRKYGAIERAGRNPRSFIGGCK